jgi:hypothetical protein
VPLDGLRQGECCLRNAYGQLARRGTHGVRNDGRCSTFADVGGEKAKVVGLKLASNCIGGTRLRVVGLPKGDVGMQARQSGAEAGGEDLSSDVGSAGFNAEAGGADALDADHADEGTVRIGDAFEGFGEFSGRRVDGIRTTFQEGGHAFALNSVAVFGLALLGVCDLLAQVASSVLGAGDPVRRGDAGGLGAVDGGAVQ